MNTFAYRTKCPQSFEKAYNLLIQQIEAHKFSVLHVHDIQQKMASKSIEHGPYKIIEFCRAPVAKRILDADPLAGVFLPCRAIVFSVDGHVEVAAMRPIVLAEYFDNTCVNDLSSHVDEDIKSIIHSLKDEK